MRLVLNYKSWYQIESVKERIFSIIFSISNTNCEEEEQNTAQTWVPIKTVWKSTPIPEATGSAKAHSRTLGTFALLIYAEISWAYTFRLNLRNQDIFLISEGNSLNNFGAVIYIERCVIFDLWYFTCISSIVSCPINSYLRNISNNVFIHIEYLNIPSSQNVGLLCSK